MTRFGGLMLFRQFCKSLDIRRFIQFYVRWPNYSHRGYHPADPFLAHVFAIVAGVGRIENTQSLNHNDLVPPLLGLPNIPHRDSLRTFLWRDKLKPVWRECIEYLDCSEIEVKTTSDKFHSIASSEKSFQFEIKETS